MDHPIVGRRSTGAPILSAFDYIIIKNGRIGYKKALESNPKRIIKIKEIEKILLTKKTLSCWTKDHKMDLWARIGTELEISLLLKTGEKHILIPTFLLSKAKNHWDWFVNELCDSTGLPLEEVHKEPIKK